MWLGAMAAADENEELLAADRSSATPATADASQSRWEDDSQEDDGQATEEEEGCLGLPRRRSDGGRRKQPSPGAQSVEKRGGALQRFREANLQSDVPAALDTWR